MVGDRLVPAASSTQRTAALWPVPVPFAHPYAVPESGVEPSCPEHEGSRRVWRASTGAEDETGATAHEVPLVSRRAQVRVTTRGEEGQ